MNSGKNYYRYYRLIVKLYYDIRARIINIKFKTKLFTIFLLVSIMPILVCTFYVGNVLVNELSNQALQDSINALDQVKTNIQNKLESYYQITTTKYMDTTLKGYLVSEYVYDTDYYDAYSYINESMKTIMTMNAGINNASIYISNKTLPSDNQYIKYIGNDKLAENWHNIVAQSSGNIVLSDTYSDEDGTLVFTIARYLNYSSFGYPYGIFALNLKESNLYDFLQEQDINKYLFITNKSGKIISCKNKAMISTDFYSIFSNSIREYINASGTSGHIDTIFENKKAMVIFTTMENDWKILSVVPYENFLSGTLQKLNNIIYVYSGSIFVCILLIYITSSVFTKRIAILSREMAKVKNEDFNINFGDMGNDEIGQLASMFKSMANEVKRLIEEGYKKEILKNQAELNLIHSQINPHFLYNTLSSISALALMENALRANEMVTLLSKFYRISLNKGKNIITLKEELFLSECYIGIQQTRFQNLLHVYFDIDQCILSYNTPKLLLQPFIENSINHGLWDNNYGVNIIISMKKVDSHIRIKIIDDGVGINPQKIKQLQELKNSTYEGFGIKNIDTRIKHFFGDEYGIKIFSRLGIGTTIEILIPQK